MTQYKELKNNKEALLSDPKATILKIFDTVHEKLTSEISIDTYMSGTTATISLIIDDVLIVANVGDSRAVLINRTDNKVSTVAITRYFELFIICSLKRDHTCEIPEESQRVLAHGARIDRLHPDKPDGGPLRIFKGSLPYPG